MVGILDRPAVKAFLREQRFARLGCHADGKTYVVPICYAYVNDRLVGQTRSGMKIAMMRKNPAVCVEVDDVRSLTDWRSVIVWGRYEELSGIQAVEAVTHLLDRLGPIFEEAQVESRLGRNVIPERPNGFPPGVEVVYAIHIDEMTGRFESSDG